MQHQIETLTFYSNAVYNPARAEAAELLVTHSYPSMRSVFFCNSGAEANETAMKIARKATHRPHIVSMRCGFHGRTIGALSATGFSPDARTIPENIDQWSRFFEFGSSAVFDMEDPEAVSAIIIEPIQSVAGVYMADPDYYRRLRQFSSDNGICLIFDEVQTGSGRTGEWYAGTHWGVEPDIVTTAKGVGGGMPAGVVIVNDRVAATVDPGDQATTFGGNPLGGGRDMCDLPCYRERKSDRPGSGLFGGGYFQDFRVRWRPGGSGTGISAGHRVFSIGEGTVGPLAGGKDSGRHLLSDRHNPAAASTHP